MANRHWIGTNSGDFNDTGNWLEGSVPTTNDNIIFKYGSVALTTNIDQSAVNFGKISIQSGYTGSIGVSVSTPFKFGCTMLRIEGGGNNAIYVASGAAASYDIEKFVMWGAGTNRATPVYLCSGTFVDVAHYAGNLVIEAGTITNMVQKTGNASLGAPNTLLKAPTVTALDVAGGVVQQTSTGTITTGRIGGNAQAIIDLGTLTTCYVSDSATVKWISTTAAITSLYLLGGTFDMSGSSSSRTITNMTIHEGALFNDPYNATTFTNDYVFYGGNVRRSSPSSEYIQ